MEEGGEAAVSAAEFALIGSRVRVVSILLKYPPMREREQIRRSPFSIYLEIDGHREDQLKISFNITM